MVSARYLRIIITGNWTQKFGDRKVAVLGLFLAGRAKESDYREVDEGKNA